MDSVGSSVMNRRLGIGREGSIGGRSAQQVEAHLERLIDRLIGGHIGLRAGLLGTLGLKVAAERCFRSNTSPNRLSPQAATVQDAQERRPSAASRNFYSGSGGE